MERGRGQMKLSFGMIFSILLIIVFLGFGIFAIIKLLGMQDATQILNFKTDLQEDVDTIWKSSKGSQEVSYSLPEAIEEVCFFYGEDLENKYDDFVLLRMGSENMGFYPFGSAEGNDVTRINNIDIEEMTFDRNPKCFQVNKGKVSMTLSKDYGDALVSIE